MRTVNDSGGQERCYCGLMGLGNGSIHFSTGHGIARHSMTWYFQCLTANTYHKSFAILKYDRKRTKEGSRGEGERQRYREREGGREERVKDAITCSGCVR